MVVTLYHATTCPVSRTVLLTVHAIDAPVEVKYISVLKREHMNPEFVKINPQHTVPTLQDGDFVLWESNAIAGYLVGRYAKNDALYPEDVKKRAIVDHRLNFATTALFPKFRDMCVPVVHGDLKNFSDQHVTALKEALAILDKFLENSQWVAGDNLTIGDFACVSVVSTIAEIPFDLSPYSNVRRWLKKCESEIKDYKEANKEGAIELGKVVRSKLP